VFKPQQAEPQEGESQHADEVEGAGGVVFRPDGAVLLLRHLDGTWVFPKGHLDPGEDALTAALREVEEEAGVRASCPDASLTETTRYKNARGTPRVITWFLLQTEVGEPVLREFLFPEGAFFAPPAAHSRLTFAEDRRLLSAMLTRLSGLERSSS
jgi:diadenosine hexaphosphate hydrolase (ATP-forming)